MAATNRVDMLDPALLRPGRFDRVIEIPLPDAASRREILRIHSNRMHLVGVGLDRIAEQTEGFSGAELQAVCREAGMIAVRREALSVTHADFLAAVAKVRAETVKDDRMYR
jgi:proteasome regulatory subunit